MPNESTNEVGTDLLHLKVVNYLGSVTSDLDVGVYQTDAVVRSKTWVRTPGYNQKFKTKKTSRLDLPMNPWLFSIRKTKNPQGSVILQSVGANLPNNQVGINVTTYTGAIQGSGYCGGSWPDVSPATLPQIDVNALNSRALGRTLSELKDQKVNLVQAYAERHQMARLYVSTIKRVTSAITFLKKGNLVDAARVLKVRVTKDQVARFQQSLKRDHVKALANMWLELQYGWMPLYRDVVGAAELLAQKSIREVRNRVVKSATASEHSVSPSTGQTAAYYIKRSVSRKVTIKYVLFYSTSETIHSLAQVGVLNPIHVAWELVPFSFVYDWFQPIGNYLSSLDATSGLTFEKGCKTTFERITVEGWTSSGQVPYTGQSTGTLLSASVNGRLQEEIVNVSREVISSFPQAELPPFKSPFSALHIANALALLKQSVRFK